MMYGWNGNGVGAWIVMAVLMVVFWGGLISLVVWLVRRYPAPDTGHHFPPTHHDAERLLSERFARGEIDEDEFTSRRNALRRTE